jgi:hypothetical protein
MVSVAIAVLLAPAVAVAQDADKQVAGGGEIAPGWQRRIDPNASRGAPPKFVAMGPGFHATSGARAIFWRPADVGTGNYTVEGTFTLTKAPAHAESYGLVVAGKEVASRAVAVRRRAKGELGARPLAQFVTDALAEVRAKALS